MPKYNFHQLLEDEIKGTLAGEKAALLAEARKRKLVSPNDVQDFLSKKMIILLEEVIKLEENNKEILSGSRKEESPPKEDLTGWLKEILATQKSIVSKLGTASTTQPLKKEIFPKEWNFKIERDRMDRIKTIVATEIK